MNVDEVQAYVDDVVRALPEDVAAAIAEVSIYVAADRQDLDVLKAAVREAGCGPVKILRNFRAVFIGVPLDQAADDEAEDVELVHGVIVLNAAMLRVPADVVDTLLHEIGHCLGFDEDEVAALGLE